MARCSCWADNFQKLLEILTWESNDNDWNPCGELRGAAKEGKKVGVDRAHVGFSLDTDREKKRKPRMTTEMEQQTRMEEHLRSRKKKTNNMTLMGGKKWLLNMTMDGLMWEKEFDRCH